MITYVAGTLVEGETTAAEQFFLQHLFHCLGAENQGVYLGDFLPGERFPTSRGRRLRGETIEQGPDLRYCKAGPLRHLAGVAMILVEQHADIALSLTEQALVIERGRIAHRGASRELAADERLLERYVGVSATQSG